MAEVGKVYLVQIAGMVVRKNGEVKNCWGKRKLVLMGLVWMILRTRKSGMGRWKLTEVEKQFLMETVGVVVCTSGVVKIREQVPFFWEFSILFIEDRVAFDHVV